MREGAGAVAYADLTRLIDALPLSLYLARRSVPCRAAPPLAAAASVMPAGQHVLSGPPVAVK